MSALEPLFISQPPQTRRETSSVGIEWAMFRSQSLVSPLYIHKSILIAFLLLKGLAIEPKGTHQERSCICAAESKKNQKAEAARVVSEL
jgi:hypothetical protein